MARGSLLLPALFLLLGGCGSQGGNEAAGKDAAANAAAVRSPRYEELPAPAPPTAEQMANALEEPISELVSEAPEGVIPEPDGMKTVVRNASCAWAPGASRARCRFERARSPMGREHDEAAEWVRLTGDWQPGEQTFVYGRTVLSEHHELRGWSLSSEVEEMRR